jgi:Rieske 2Fe-2S family protein
VRRLRLYHEFPVGTIERKTLPSSCYTNPEWFVAEMEHIFATMWIAVGRAEDVARRGAFVRHDVGNASILVIGDGDRIRAFHNVCRHRGTRLCEAADGILSGSVQCPYHGWTYGLDGRLIGAPHMDEVEGFRKDDYPLSPVACAAWDGHVFVHLGADPAPLASQLGALPAAFRPWRMAELRRVHRLTYTVQANWKLIVQNYNECLHCPIIHPLLNRMHHYLGAANVPSTGSYCGGAMGFKDGVETLSVDGRLRRATLPGLSDEQRTQVNYYAIYPNLLLTLHPDYMVTVTIWPETPDRTRLVSDWHFHPDEIARPGFVFEDAVEFWDVTNREDWAISERSQRGIRSRGYLPGPYSNRETQLWEFDRFILSRVPRV